MRLRHSIRARATQIKSSRSFLQLRLPLSDDLAEVLRPLSIAMVVTWDLEKKGHVCVENVSVHIQSGASDRSLGF